MLWWNLYCKADLILSGIEATEKIYQQLSSIARGKKKGGGKNKKGGDKQKIEGFPSSNYT